MPRTENYEQLCAQMVAAIEREVAETQAYTGRARLSDRVKQAMAMVPRHEFVPTSLRHEAYYNHPLPIGYGQTISQPYIVALMTDLLEPQAGDRVLEIGTGSGYQAAVLSSLVEWVYSIEAVPELAARAAQDLSRLGYGNVTVKAGNGCLGWPEFAPFDGIIVTAGGDVPPALLEQLKPGGRLVIPVEHRDRAQSLTLFEKGRDGQLRESDVLPVRFVPLTGNNP